MMKTEKTIKAQARNALGKGNWATLVGCLTIMLISVFLTEWIYEALIYGFDIVDTTTFEFKESGIFLGNIFTLLYIILLIFISPVANGFFKICYNVAKNENSVSSDLFYYFKRPKLYFKALGLNIIRYAYVSLCIFILTFAANTLFDFSNNLTSPLDIFILIAAVILGISVTIICFCIYTRTIFSNFILADDNSKSVFYYIKESFALSKGHNKDILKLLFSFIFWILSCFFIFPIFYVIPYMGVSLGTSAKWLILLKKEVSD